MKKQFGLPTRDEKNAIFSYHFYRLMYRVKKVYILYDGQGDGLGAGEKSRFVRQWATQLPENHSMRFFNQSVTLNTVTRQRLEVPKTPSLLKRLQEMAQKGLSATALSNYIADPIRFYNNYVLRISETEEFEESIAYKTLGTVIHNTLEELYSPYVLNQLTVQNIEKMQDTHKQILQKHFEEELGKSSHKTGKNLLLFTAAAHSIRRVLEADKIDILAGSTIELLGLEEYRKVTRTYAGLEHPITFHGVIDRIDRKDGILRILDYKTGQTNTKELRPNEVSDCLSDSIYGKSFQVLFYSMLWAEDDPNSPFYAGVISVKNMSSGTMFLGLGSSRTKRTELVTEDLEKFEKELEKLAIEIYTPDIAFTEAI
jgi:ATP-dependent helicase/DNAse subunit B